MGSLGMNVESLGKVLKMCGPSDSLKLRWQDGEDIVNFQCESGDDRITDFTLKLMQIESEHMEIPEQHYKVIAKLPSSEFQKICKDLKEFGETMQMKATKGGRETRGASCPNSSRSSDCDFCAALLGELLEGCTSLWLSGAWVGTRCATFGEV